MNREKDSLVGMNSLGAERVGRVRMKIKSPVKDKKGTLCSRSYLDF